MQMSMDLQGFVEGNVQLSTSPKSRCLLPVYEAVANSIHAIQHANEQADRPARGRIDIHIHRDRSQGVLKPTDDQRSQLHPVATFTITDNGIGFDDRNFASFNTGFTRLKQHLGAKGRGRFMWLKVFQRAEVDSVFLDGCTSKRRQFAFTLPNGTEGGEQPEDAVDEGRTTTVKLIGMRPPYKEAHHRHVDAIANCLVHRFVQLFAMRAMPVMFLHDPDGDDATSINLNDLFEHQKLKVEDDRFQLNGVDFGLRHMLLHRRGHLKHEVHFCAHDQVITSEGLESRITDLKAQIADDETGEAVVYHGYVSGAFLDDSVTPERTDFSKIEGNGHLPHKEAIPWTKVVDASVDHAAKFLNPYTRTVKEDKVRRIKHHVQNEAPWYRHVVKDRPDLIERIPPTASGNELDIALYQASQQHERDLRQQAAELLEEGDAPEKVADYREKLDRFLEQFSAAGKDQLAKYVAHRKAILSFLSDQLKRREDGKHQLEEDIHQVIFPMRKSSDDVEPDRMNLWIIDERLAFHYYLASDMPLRSIKPMDVDSRKELDLLIFDRPFFFGEDEVDIGAAVIVEFKRPMADNRDPIRQVFGYVRTVRAGTATKDGRPLKVKEGTPFYAYILCDLTKKMCEYAEDAGLTKTPDGEGYIGFNGVHGVYMEVISYNKAVKDAQKRNAILFHKLGLPMALAKPAADADIQAGADGNMQAE